MKRSEYMSADQQFRWKQLEERAGRKLPRTHRNCMLATGVARPGATAQARAKRVR